MTADRGNFCLQAEMDSFLVHRISLGFREWETLAQKINFQPRRHSTAHVSSNKWFKKNFTRAQMLETIEVCRDCHGAIHDLIPDEKELGRHYHSIELLLEHEPFANFVRWVSKQK